MDGKNRKNNNKINKKEGSKKGTQNTQKAKNGEENLSSAFVSFSRELLFWIVGAGVAFSVAMTLKPNPIVLLIVAFLILVSDLVVKLKGFRFFNFFDGVGTGLFICFLFEYTKNMTVSVILAGGVLMISKEILVDKFQKSSLSDDEKLTEEAFSRTKSVTDGKSLGNTQKIKKKNRQDKKGDKDEEK